MISLQEDKMCPKQSGKWLLCDRGRNSDNFTTQKPYLILWRVAVIKYHELDLQQVIKVLG